MVDKKYYSGDELDKMIKVSILKQAKKLAVEIKNEKLDNKKVSYV